MFKLVSIYGLGELFSRLGKILYVYLLALILLKEDFGYYNYILALAGVILIFLDCGLGANVVLRAHSRKFKRLFGLFLSAKVAVLTTVSVVFLLYYTAQSIFSTDALTATILLTLLLAIFWDLSAFLANAHRANFDYLGDAVSKVIGNGLGLIFLVAAYIGSVPLTISQALLIQIFSFALVVVWSLVRIRKRGIIFYPWTVKSWRKLLVIIKIGAMFALAASSGSLLASMDMIILGYFKELELLASFSIAHRAGLLTYVPMGIVLGYLLPHLSSSFGQGKSVPVHRLLDIFMCICCLMALALSQCYILGIEWLIVPRLNESYGDLPSIARIMALYVLPIYVHTVIWTLLCAMRHSVIAQMPAALATLVTAITDLALIHGGQSSLVVWTPVVANWIMLIVLVSIYRIKTGCLPFGKRAVAVYATCFLVMLGISFPGKIDAVVFSMLRFLLVILSIAGALWFAWKLKILNAAPAG